MTSDAGDDHAFARGFDDGDVVGSNLYWWHTHLNLSFGLDLAIGASDTCDSSMSAHVPYPSSMLLLVHLDHYPNEETLTGQFRSLYDLCR
jgi:hypothetical protein